MPLSDTPYQVIGTRPIRHDGLDKVTGRAAYGADFSLPGMLHGAVLRSPHAHARIVSIDTSAAEAVPGVMAVVTDGASADVGECAHRVRSPEAFALPDAATSITARMILS